MEKFDGEKLIFHGMSKNVYFLWPDQAENFITFKLEFYLVGVKKSATYDLWLKSYSNVSSDNFFSEHPVYNHLIVYIL